MPNKLNGYKVFIASPGGLEDERKAFAKEIEDTIQKVLIESIEVKQVYSVIALVKKTIQG